MNKIVLMVAVLAYSVFADTMYFRNGQEIKDASITEVGTSEIKYRVGERETIYTAKKSEIVLVLYNDGSKDVFDYCETKAEIDNFSSGQRWGTFGLNMLVPGLGSYLIMGDVLGGTMQVGLYLTGMTLMLIGIEEDSGYDDYYDDGGSDDGEILIVTGISLLAANLIFNIVRSAVHDKPGNKKTAYSNNNDGLNFAVMPNKQGKPMPYLFYSKAF